VVHFPPESVVHFAAEWVVHFPQNTQWKTFPTKAEFAQDFSIHLLENLAEAKLSFKVPQYILNALNHLKNGL